MLAVEIRDVIPRAGHQLELVGDRLVGSHGSAGGAAGESVLQCRVVQRRTALKCVMPAGHEKHRDAVLGDLRHHVRWAHGVPEGAIECGIAAGHRVVDQALEVGALVAAPLPHGGNAAGPGPFMSTAMRELQRRVDHVQQRVGGAVGADRTHVRDAAHGDDVAIEVVGGHRREDRLQRRAGSHCGCGHQLVDGQIRDAEHADAAVRVGQRRSPIDQIDAVLDLLGSQHLEGAARHTGAPHVGHHLDVATANQIRCCAAADLGSRRGCLLAVRRHRQQHGEGPGSGLARPRIGRIVDIHPQRDAVTHRHRHVVVDTDAVLRRRGFPRWQ